MSFNRSDFPGPVAEKREPDCDTPVWVTTLKPYQVPGLWDAGCQYSAAGAPKSWQGATVKEVDSMIRNGHRESVTEAQALEQSILDKVTSQCIKGSRTVSSVYGGSVCAPAALAGVPRAMRRRTRVRKPGVRLWIGIGATGNYSADEVRTYSTACIALARAVAVQRPVEVRLVRACYAAGAGRAAIMIPVGVAPIDWAQMGALTHVGVYRRCLIAASHALGHGEFTGEVMTGTSHDIRGDFGASLGIQPNDLVISGMHGAVVDNPARWVAEQLEKLK